jgi:nicotinate-nucleotide adenylyltransferase
VKRIGLFGGSFDPVHLGHLLVARSACEEAGLDRLFFIPAAQSPFKHDTPLGSASDRLRLLRLALAGCARYEVDDQEIRRGGVSYSIDTVRHFASRHADAALFYLIGADHLAQLPKWRDAGALAALAAFLVIPRPGEPAFALPDCFRLTHLTGIPVGVSSSMIRARVKDGQPIDHLTPAPVAEAIHNNRLYL